MPAGYAALKNSFKNNTPEDGQISASNLKHDFNMNTLRSVSLVFYILFSGTSHSTRKPPMQKQYNAAYKGGTPRQMLRMLNGSESLSEPAVVKTVVI